MKLFMMFDNGRKSAVKEINSLNELKGYNIVKLEKDSVIPKVGYPSIYLRKNLEPGFVKLTYDTYRQLRRGYISSETKNIDTLSLILLIDDKLRKEFNL